MTRLLYLTSTLRRSGPTNQLYNLVKYLDRKEYKPYLVTLSPEPPDSRWEDFERMEVNVLTLGLSRVGGALGAKKQLSVLLDEVKPGLLHAHGFRADVLSSFLRHRMPILSTIHNFPQLDYPMRYGRIIGNLMVWRHAKAMQHLECCVGVSSAVSENLKRNFSVMNACHIRNGVDTEVYFAVGDAEKISIREKLDLPRDSRIWVACGHLSELKDPLAIIRAFKRYARDRNEFLVFVGDGKLGEACRKAASGSGNISICGRVSNVAEYLQASDYFVSVSKAEGLPNAVLEALSCGLPVLLSNIEPHAEILGLNESAGLVYPLGDDAALEGAFYQMAGKDYSGMRQAALDIIDTHLSAGIMSEKYQQLYESLIK